MRHIITLPNFSRVFLSDSESRNFSFSYELEMIDLVVVQDYEPLEKKTTIWSFCFFCRGKLLGDFKEQVVSI